MVNNILQYLYKVSNYHTIFSNHSLIFPLDSSTKLCFMFQHQFWFFYTIFRKKYIYSLPITNSNEFCSPRTKKKFVLFLSIDLGPGKLCFAKRNNYLIRLDQHLDWIMINNPTKYYFFEEILCEKQKPSKLNEIGTQFSNNLKITKLPG